MRMQSMFGPNPMMGQGNGMGQPMSNMYPGAGYGMYGNNARFMNPQMGYMQRMNPYGNNMNMMQMPGMQNQMMYGNQMGRPGMMGYNPMMTGFNPNMMNYPMGGNMMNNPQFSMMQNIHQMNPMARGMTMNPMIPRPPNSDVPIGTDNGFVPGTLEDNAIHALNNADYKYTEAHDLLPEDIGEDGKGEIIDPGPYNLDWLLDEGESERDFQNSTFFTPEELNLIVSRSVQFEQLYLVKWTNLSYKDATWEPYSLIQQYDELIESFENRNKRLDAASRQKLSKDREVHKKIVEHLGISEKKRKNLEEDEIDNHLKLFKYRQSLFANKVPYDVYKKDEGNQPVFKKGQRFKEYQINGANWLIKAWHDNRNVILADEMGLGKTIQTVGFLNFLFTQEKVLGPF